MKIGDEVILSKDGLAMNRHFYAKFRPGVYYRVVEIPIRDERLYSDCVWIADDDGTIHQMNQYYFDVANRVGPW